MGNTADLSIVPEGYDPSKHTIKGPTIITGLGNYITRNGRTVEVFEIKDNRATFNVHGYLLMPRANGKGFRRIWGIWHVSGAARGHGQHRWDIMEKAVPAADATILLSSQTEPTGPVKMTILKGRPGNV